MTYRLRPRETGLWPTNVRADLTYTDAYGRPGALVFPVPRVLVRAPETPSPTPTPPTPTATPSPTATPPPRWTIYLPLLLRERCDNDRLHITLVIDASSSMTLPFGPGTETKLAAARAAARAMLDQVDLGRDTVGLVQFNHSARSLAHGSDRAALEAALAGLSVEQGTRIDLGLSVGLADARAARERPGARQVLVLLTDGTPDPGTATDALAAAEAVRLDGVTLYTVAVGADADRPFLSLAAADPARAFYVADGGELVRLYDRLGATLVPCVPSWAR
jgi:Mg-chelatase subunit ChlD